LNTSILTPVLRILFVLLFAAIFARGDQASNLTEAQKDAIIKSLQRQTGTITLNDGLAKIALTNGFRYLGSADARKVLHDIGNNPDDPDILGMIFPKGDGLNSQSGYVITVSYEEQGYVKDDDADKIDYNDLLKRMQQEAHNANPERIKEGYDAMELIGWAQPPRYDKATHKLYWAKEYKFGDETVHTLNYDIRILGRRGTLVLTVLASMTALSDINNDIPSILAMVDFQPGNTYAEFDPKIDKVAEYGLAGLIAGGAIATAAKLGLLGAFFKWIVAGVLLLKKALIVVVVAVIAGIKKLWSTITGKSKTPSNLLPPNSGGPPKP
jgi:uncharacterized membrane-anchored protein